MMLEDADLAHDRGEALGLLGRGVDERKANSADGEADELERFLHENGVRGREQAAHERQERLVGGPGFVPLALGALRDKVLHACRRDVAGGRDDAGAAEAPKRARRLALHDLTNRTEGAKGWTVSQARTLFRDGYSRAQVCRVTGWGGYWLSDLDDGTGYCAWASLHAGARHEAA